MPVVGLLNSTSPTAWAHLASAFLQGLSEMGYIEHRSVGIEWRWAAGKSERYREDTLREAGISSRRQAKYQRRMASLLAGRAR